MLVVTDYQRAARSVSLYPSKGSVYYPALGLAGEAGEIANKVKKIIRGDVTFEQRLNDLRAELGDCCWYVSAMASDLCIELLELVYEASQNTTSIGDLYDHVLELNVTSGRIASLAIDWRKHGVHPDRRDLIRNQLVRALQIMAGLAVILKTDLKTVSTANIMKLLGRDERGTLLGDGDNR